MAARSADQGFRVWRRRTLRAARREGRLVWYTGPNPVTPLLAAAFRRAHPGLEMEIVALDGPVISERFYEDKDAGREVCDVLCAGSGQCLEDYKVRGYLATLEALPHWRDIPDWAKDRDGCYYHYINSRFGIMYNSRLLPDREAPRSFAELVEPRWRRRVALTHPSSRGMGLRFFRYAAEYPGLGWRWIARLRRVEPLILPMAGGPLTALVLEGGRAVAVHRDLEAAFLRRQEPSIRFRRVAEAAPVQLIPMAVNARARHPNAARLFVDWVMSAAARRLLEGYGYGYPIRRGVPGPDRDPRAWLQPLGSFRPGATRRLVARVCALLRQGEYTPTIPARIRF
ncbi:MAG: extracellular solute-binding protein [Elusimicrobia bacterium]|nr:extracellular solute-binding protein [Elusimicrobiota bacterium]